ncbi:MAG TPA: hypothetical protein VGH98_24020 [Gemmatimonadaceae bacterium]
MGLAGIATGLAGGLVAGRLLGHQLYGVDALDVKVYVVAALVLALASIASTYPAVLRARRLSPLVAIRAE